MSKQSERKHSGDLEGVQMEKMREELEEMRKALDSEKQMKNLLMQ